MEHPFTFDELNGLEKDLRDFAQPELLGSHAAHAIAMLRRCLEIYGGHLDECKISPCTCGLDHLVRP